MLHKKTIVGTAILAMYWMLGAISSVQEGINISFPESTCLAQIGNYAMDDSPECEAARRLAKWICGDLLDFGIVQLTEGVVDQVDLATWESLNPLITNAIDEIYAILSMELISGKTGAGATGLDTSSMTTEDMANEACDRALKAVEELCNASNPDYEYTGELLQETLWLLEDLYLRAQP